DHPVLRNAGLGIEAELRGAVVGQRAVGHFDQEKGVLGPGLTLFVRHAPAAEDSQIRLGLGVLAEHNGVLHPHEGTAGQPCDQELVEVANECPVATVDGRHRDDFALDQLDAVVFAENTDLGHPVVLRPRETPSCCHDLDRHSPPPARSRAHLIDQRIAGRRALRKVPGTIHRPPHAGPLHRVSSTSAARPTSAFFLSSSCASSAPLSGNARLTIARMRFWRRSSSLWAISVKVTKREPWISSMWPSTRRGSIMKLESAPKTAVGRLPMMTSRPARASDFSELSSVSRDATKSIAASTPRPSVSFATCAARSPRRGSTSASAPHSRAAASLASEMSAAITQPPESLAICTACMPPPPPAPTIKTASPGPTRASSRQAW